MTDIAISVRDVSKCYRVFNDQRSRLLHAISPRRTQGVQEVWALKDISFEIKRGEAVAIIGRNGGGKSTLLEILTGTLAATTGEVQVNGRVSALLELGSGFNPEYSGRDNVILNGLLLGLSKADILSRFAEIEAFAEIGAAIDRPVKTYSSGMMMRLAFAVQVLCDPDILIIDEALSVGDFFFQQKCLMHIRGMCAKGVTLLFVSHDMQTVRDLCTKGLFLKNGQIGFWGSNLQAINHYLRVNDATADIPLDTAVASIESCDAAVPGRTSLPNPLWVNNSPSDDSCILEVGIYSTRNEAVTSAKIGEQLKISVRYRDLVDDWCHVTGTLKNRFGQIVTTFGTYTCGTEMSGMVNPERALEMHVTMMLEAGQYSLQLNLGQAVNFSTGLVKYETPWIGPITVTWDYQAETPPFYGLVGLPVEVGFI